MFGFGKSACDSGKDLLFSNFQESRLNYIWYCSILLHTFVHAHLHHRFQKAFQITHCVYRHSSDVPSGFRHQMCTEGTYNDTKCFSSSSCFESLCSCFSNIIWWLLWRVTPSPPHKFWTVMHYWASPYKTQWASTLNIFILFPSGQVCRPAFMQHILTHFLL